MDAASMNLIRKVTYPPLGDRPVEILESRLYQDAETMQIGLSLTMENRSEKLLNAVYLDLCGFDEEVQLVITKDRVPYTNLSAEPGAIFGAESMISLASLRVRSITATLHHAVFADGSVWSPKETLPVKEFFDLPKDLSPGRRKKKRFRRILAWSLALLLLGGGLGAAGMYQTSMLNKELLANTYFQNGQYADALVLYQELAHGFNPLTPQAEYDYKQALCHIRAGSWQDALSLLGTQTEHAPSLRLLRQINALLAGIVSAGENHSVALCTNGMAYASGDNSLGQCNVGEWRNLVALAAGSRHTLGLTQNGSVLYAGETDALWSQVTAWRHAVSIAAGESHSVAALSNGRVVAAGDNSYGQCDTQGWSGVVAVAAGKNHTVALRVDGTVLANGDNPSGGCNVEDWRDVISIAAGDGFTLGIQKDGTLLIAGALTIDTADTLSAVFAGTRHGIAKSYDGKLIAGGDNTQHQSQVGHWENLLTAAGGGEHTVAICTDGTAVAIGRNTHSQCEVANWTGIGIPPIALHLSGIASEY